MENAAFDWLHIFIGHACTPQILSLFFFFHENICTFTLFLKVGPWFVER